MFQIFNFLPDLLWPALLLLGILGFFASYLPPLKPYALLIKIAAGALILTTIFIFGMLYSNRAWQQAAAELQQKLDLAVQESKTVNEVIKEKTITKLQIVKVRGDTITEYVTREVAKHDSGCVIPPEFVQAHNLAAEVPK